MYSVSSPFPLSELTLCFFATSLAEQGLAPSTIKSYLAAVRSIQISLGLPDPRDQSSCPMLKRVLAGISRARLSKGVQARVRLPITAPLMVRIQSALNHSDNPDKVLFWAITCLAFFGFFRLGELLPNTAKQYHPSTHLSWGDVAVNDRAAPSILRVHLKRSKCDQFGRGLDIYVGKTNSSLCPVTAVVDYIRLRGDYQGPFFLFRDLKPVLKPWLTQQLRQILNELGLPSHQFAGHSFRIGAATSAAMAGVEDSTIQTLGRWQSSAFMGYIRLPQAHLAQISSRLATATTPYQGNPIISSATRIDPPPIPHNGP